MSMKKIIAGIAAASLAVTSLATVASAAETKILGKVTPTVTHYFYDYVIKQNSGKSITVPGGVTKVVTENVTKLDNTAPLYGSEADLIAGESKKGDAAGTGETLDTAFDLNWTVLDETASSEAKAANDALATTGGAVIATLNIVENNNSDDTDWYYLGSSTATIRYKIKNLYILGVNGGRTYAFHTPDGILKAVQMTKAALNTLPAGKKNVSTVAGATLDGITGVNSGETVWWNHTTTVTDNVATNTEKLTDDGYATKHDDGIYYVTEGYGVPLSTMLSDITIRYEIAALEVYNDTTKGWDAKEVTADWGYTNDLKPDFETKNPVYEVPKVPFDAGVLALTPAMGLRLNNFEVKDDGATTANKIDFSVKTVKPDVSRTEKTHSSGVLNIPVYSEDASQTGNAGTPNYAASIRLTNEQMADLKELAPTDTLLVEIKYKDKVGWEGGCMTYVYTDLSKWHGDNGKTYGYDLGKDGDVAYVNVPAIEFYDPAYDNRSSSGYLGRLYIDGDVASWAEVTEITISYVKGGGSAKPGSDEKPKTMGTTSTKDGVEYKYEITFTESALYGNADYFSVDYAIADGRVGYTFNLTNNGEKANLAGAVDIKMYAPSGFKFAAGQTTVDHVKDDGTTEKVAIKNAATYVEDGYIAYTLTSFSTVWADIEEDGDPADTEPADTEPADTEPADTEPSDNGPTDGGSEEDNKAPNTGVVLFAIPAVAAAAGVLVFKKRK